VLTITCLQEGGLNCRPDFGKIVETGRNTCLYARQNSNGSGRYAEGQRKAELKARAEGVRAKMRESHLAGFRDEVKQRCAFASAY
jgi:hypothetical protein